MVAVTFSEHSTQCGRKIGHARLNKPAALNALSLEMVKLLLPQLQAWQADSKIIAVLLDGEGDKAFCAGGDVVALHSAMAETEMGIPALVEAFFSQEYRLDYLLHTYGKPVVVWGTGIVMGGGLGLMVGASHRIVTQTTRMAMPEITIGLYPDVGGSYFLGKMPKGCGLFLGLTGASINGSDALYAGMADYAMASDCREQFIQAMTEADWQGATNAHETLHRLCDQMQQRDDLAPSNLHNHQKLIGQVTEGEHLEHIVKQILSLDAGDDKWLSRAQKTLSAGSPISANLVWQQLTRSKNLSLADCFRQELTMSCRCAELGEFEEGVRALLIDKDNQPNWLYDSVSEVPDEVLDTFFTSPWEVHPLNGLGME